MAEGGSRHPRRGRDGRPGRRSRNPDLLPPENTDRGRRVAPGSRIASESYFFPLWGFAWRCPWRWGGLRLGHWRRLRLGLGHRGGAGSHRLEWRRPRWLAWARRVTRVWHGDSLFIPVEPSDP